MEKWLLQVLQPERGWRGVSVNWDGAVNRGYPQFNQNLPNLAKMTNWRRGEVWKFDPFYTFIEQGGALAVTAPRMEMNYRIVLIIDP